MYRLEFKIPPKHLLEDEGFIFEKRQRLLCTFLKWLTLHVGPPDPPLGRSADSVCFTMVHAESGYPHVGVLQTQHLSDRMQLNTMLMTQRYLKFMWEYSKR